MNDVSIVQENLNQFMWFTLSSKETWIDHFLCLRINNFDPLEKKQYPKFNLFLDQYSFLLQESLIKPTSTSQFEN